MKKYIIVGSNNYWYDVFETDKPHIVNERIQWIKDEHKALNYPFQQPDEIILYEVGSEIKISMPDL